MVRHSSTGSHRSDDHFVCLYNSHKVCVRLFCRTRNRNLMVHKIEKNKQQTKTVVELSIVSPSTNPSRSQGSQVMFLQTTDTFTSVHLRGYIPFLRSLSTRYFYTACTITFSLHVCYVTFRSGGGGEGGAVTAGQPGGSQASDHSSRVRFNICKFEATGYFNLMSWHFNICKSDTYIFRETSGQLQSQLS